LRIERSQTYILGPGRAGWEIRRGRNSVFHSRSTDDIASNREAGEQNENSENGKIKQDLPVSHRYSVFLLFL
jgi:hypothetical protein